MLKSRPAHQHQKGTPRGRTRKANMAKDKDNPLDQGKTKSISVGLTEGEIEALNSLAARYKGITRNKIMRYILRSWLDQHQAGEVELPIETKTSHDIDF